MYGGGTDPLTKLGWKHKQVPTVHADGQTLIASYSSIPSTNKNQISKYKNGSSADSKGTQLFLF
jgi:hypothetical protein